MMGRAILTFSSILDAPAGGWAHSYGILRVAEPFPQQATLNFRALIRAFCRQVLPDENFRGWEVKAAPLSPQPDQRFQISTALSKRDASHAPHNLCCMYTVARSSNCWANDFDVRVAAIRSQTKCSHPAGNRQTAQSGTSQEDQFEF